MDTERGAQLTDQFNSPGAWKRGLARRRWPCGSSTSSRPQPDVSRANGSDGPHATRVREPAALARTGRGTKNARDQRQKERPGRESRRELPVPWPTVFRPPAL
jgi:hypothetical protein